MEGEKEERRGVRKQGEVKVVDEWYMKGGEEEREELWDERVRVGMEGKGRKRWMVQWG